MADALTTLRLLLVAPFALAMARPGRTAAGVAALLLGVAIVTDVLDGRVARRRRTAGTRGRVYDHGTDFVLVMAGLVAGAARGAFPWALPAAIAVAFTVYLVGSLRADPWTARWHGRWGRTNGIGYFAPLVVDAALRVGPVGRAGTLDVAGVAADLLGWALVTSSALWVAAVPAAAVAARASAAR